MVIRWKGGVRKRALGMCYIRTSESKVSKSIPFRVIPPRHVYRGIIYPKRRFSFTIIIIRSFPKYFKSISRNGMPQTFVAIWVSTQ